MSQGAFKGEIARKQALAADIAAKGPAYTAWLTPDVLDANPGQIAADQGLHPAIGCLLPVMGLYAQEPGSQAFYEEAIAAIPVGADEAEIIRCWFLWAWDHPVYGFKTPLIDTPLLAPAEAIIALIGQSRTAPIEPRLWRQARAALSAKVDETGADADIADPILSMAWGLDRTPAIAADVLNAWSGPVYMAAYRSGDWSEEDGQTYGAQHGEFSRQAMAQLGEIRQGDPEQYAQYKAIMKTLWESAPELADLYRRQQEHDVMVKQVVGAWRTEVQRGFIDCARAAKPALAVPA
uniref:hypothetical protein n=1 Tax=uncultured Caulobacter sp. TaxID=158749 RepID=UPI0025E79C66|nr:hypothetical protein [uncultured Caulobacter sp.]